MLADFLLVRTFVRVFVCPLDHFFRIYVRLWIRWYVCPCFICSFVRVLFVCLSDNSFVYLYVVFFISSFDHLFSCSCVRLSLFGLFVCLCFVSSFVCALFVRLSVLCLFVCLCFVCSFVRLHVCSNIRLSVYTFARMSVCPFTRLLVCPFVRLHVCPFYFVYLLDSTLR